MQSSNTKSSKFQRYYAPVFIAGTAVFFLASAYRLVFKSDERTAKKSQSDSLSADSLATEKPTQ